MKANVTTNAILAIIAACLVLIAAKLCNIGFVANASAQGPGVTMMNTLPSLTPVALYAKSANGKWYPCQLSTNNTLIVQVQP